MKFFSKLIFLFFLISVISCLNKQKDCKCRILPKSKIVGGTQAHHLAYPWIVNITPNYDDTLWFFKSLIKEEHKLKFHSCGGTIINEYYVLTAAHCIPKETSQPLYVGYGNDNDLVKIFDFGRIKSIRTIINSGYVYNLFEPNLLNDIAIIELEKPIEFTEYVKPACFLNENQKLFHSYLEHAGWGSTEVYKINKYTKRSIKPNTSRNLKEIFLTDQSNTYPTCEYNEKIICAKGMKKDESSCKGDSGGPVHYTKNGKSYVVGLTSYSNNVIFEENYYKACVGTTIYTKVTSFHGWIKRYVEDDICEF